MTEILDSTKKSADPHKSGGGVESQLCPGDLVTAGDDFRVSHTPERNASDNKVDDPWIEHRQPGIVVASIVLDEDKYWDMDNYTVFANSIGWVYRGLLHPTGDKC